MDHLADLDLDVLTRALNAMNEASERDATRKR
jgi:hypothetical protein